MTDKRLIVDPQHIGSGPVADMLRDSVARGTVTTPIFRYDLAGPEPRVILITELNGSRRACPRLGYVVLPTPASQAWRACEAPWSDYSMVERDTGKGAYDAPWRDVYADCDRATVERE